MPVAQQAVDRARWLAEVSTALAEAQRLLQRWISIGGDIEPLIDVQKRVEDLRSAVRALQHRCGGPKVLKSRPIWIEPSPWHPGD